MATDKIILYGTSWCGDTRRVREYFEINKIEFKFKNNLKISIDNLGILK